MEWKITVSDDPARRPQSSNEVIITAAEDQECNWLADRLRQLITGMGREVCTRWVYADELRSMGYTIPERAWVIYEIAASRIKDSAFSVRRHCFDSIRGTAEQQYFVIARCKRQPEIPDRLAQSSRRDSQRAHGGGSRALAAELETLVLGGNTAPLPNHWPIGTLTDRKG